MRLPFSRTVATRNRLPRIANRFGLAASVLWLSLAVPLGAAEPADAFLGALRLRGYHDTALEYLEWANESPLINESWRIRIPYHRSVALIESASQLSPAAAAAPTAEAEKLLSEFVASHGDLSEAKIANFWLGRILSDKARRELKTVTDDMSGAAKRKIRKPAAEMFRQAQEAFGQSNAFFQAELTEMKKLAPAQLDTHQRDQYRAYYLEGELNRALIDYELAETVATNKKDYKAQLKVAKASLGKLAVEQSKRLAGVQAKIYQARCYEDLDEIDDALDIYQEIIDELALPDSISAQAVLRSMACSVDDKQAPQQAIETAINWLQARNPAPNSQPAQAVRLEAGRQIVAVLPSLDENELRKLKASAKEMLADAQQAGGSGRTEALQLMASIGLNPTNGPARSTGKATSFTAAKDNAERLRAELQPLIDAEKLLKENLDRSSDPTNRAEIAAQIAESRQALISKRKETIAAFRNALALADEHDNPDQVHEAYYLCCYVYYTAEAFHEAAVLGQYTAQVAPNLPSAKSSANIALASYVQLYQRAGADNSAEAAFLVRIATFIAETWPNSQEAQDSLTMLIGFMVNDGNIAQAEVFLQQIPSESPRRAEAELRTGQAIWRSYLRQMQSANGEPVANAEQLKQRAQGLLLEGINRTRGKAVTATTAQGALALSQIYVDVNSPDKAIALLQDSEFGPLTLIEKKDPIGSTPGFLEQAYKSALRAQIGSLAQPNVDAKEAVQQAMDTMQSLSDAVGDSPQGKQRLTATYISLAKDLQRQLQLSTAETRSDIAKAFESFLNQVASGSSEPSVLNWVAETYFSLAEGERDLSARSPKAQEYFDRSAAVFTDLLQRNEQGSLTLADAMVPQVQVRAAAANLRAAKYKQAFDLYEQVLATKNTMLNVQVEAARALQEGAERGNVDMFNQAVKGDRPQDNKNVIWGWEKISKITAAQMRKSPELRSKFGDVFFDSRYNIARCRYKQGVGSAGETKSQRLTAAKRAISMTANLYPDLGGESWRRKFDKLMKEVQSSLGEEATGLETP